MSRRTIHPLALLLVTLGGCSAPSAAPPPAPVAVTSPAITTGAEPGVMTTGEADTLQAFDEATATMDEQLEAFSLASDPDCGAAAELRDRMCELASRVCDIADRHPGDPELEERCADGDGRCGRARDAVDARCAD